MHVLYMMIGAPGSGKTFLAIQIRTITNGFLICPDLIRERFQWPNGKIFDYAYHRLSTALARGQSCILDATSTNPIHRQRAITFARHHQAEIVGIWMDTPLTICLDRHRRRQANASQASLTPEIIRRYHDELQATPPCLEEGFDRLVRLAPSDVPFDIATLTTPPTT